MPLVSEWRRHKPARQTTPYRNCSRRAAGGRRRRRRCCRHRACGRDGGGGDVRVGIGAALVAALSTQ